MKTEHVLLFVEYQIHHWENARKKLEAVYAEAAKKYEAKFIPKLFGWKYQNSHKGDRSWLANKWGFIQIDDKINEYKILRDKAIYYKKIGNNSIGIPLRMEKYFYNFCASNNIPY